MDSDDKAMDNSSLGAQKTVLTLGRKPLPMPSSKNGNKIHTGLDQPSSTVAAALRWSAAAIASSRVSCWACSKA